MFIFSHKVVQSCIKVIWIKNPELFPQVQIYWLELGYIMI